MARRGQKRKQTHHHKRTQEGHARANFHYQHLLRITKTMVGNKTTFGTDLNRTARQLFGKRFAGVFMSDKIPAHLQMANPRYAIINLDDSTEPGSHWIAVARTSWVTKKLLVHDSYGRINQVPPMIMRLYPRSVVTDPDVEQGLRETNCGARALAWLLMMEIFPEEAPLI